MTRWLIAPLVAALLMSGSGFLSELEQTTESSVDLAAGSEEAPRETRDAARELGDLPAAADLTQQQADAFRALSDALDISAQRVFALNDALGRQTRGLEQLKSRLAALSDPLACIREQLMRVGGLAERVPPALDGVSGILGSLIASQEKSLRHLKSINRKLTALGVAARATDVKVPPAPEAPEVPRPDPTITPKGC